MYRENCWNGPGLLLKFWEDISSFGGFAGGLLGLWLFFRFKARDVDAAGKRAFHDPGWYEFLLVRIDWLEAKE